MEVVSNLRLIKILGEGSKHRLSTLTFVRTFSLFTMFSSNDQKIARFLMP